MIACLPPTVNNAAPVFHRHRADGFGVTVFATFAA